MIFHCRKKTSLKKKIFWVKTSRDTFVSNTRRQHQKHSLLAKIGGSKKLSIRLFVHFDLHQFWRRGHSYWRKFGNIQTLLEHLQFWRKSEQYFLIYERLFPCGWQVIVVGELVRLVDLTSYSDWNFHVHGSATQVVQVVS